MKKIVTLLVAFVFAGIIAGKVMATEAAAPAAAPAKAAEIKCKVGDKVEAVKTEKECTDKGGKVEKAEEKK